MGHDPRSGVGVVIVREGVPEAVTRSMAEAQGWGIVAAFDDDGQWGMGLSWYVSGIEFAEMVMDCFGRELVEVASQ